jgi:hypothetical protein
MESDVQTFKRDPMFTFHVGRLCGGGVGFVFRWFGRADEEQFRVVLSIEGR